MTIFFFPASGPSARHPPLCQEVTAGNIIGHEILILADMTLVSPNYNVSCCDDLPQGGECFWPFFGVYWRPVWSMTE